MINPNAFELLIKPREMATKEEIEEGKKDRDHLLYLLARNVMLNHPHAYEESGFYQAFKNKKPVRYIGLHGDEDRVVYIHKIETYINWENHGIVNKYTIRSGTGDEFRKEYEEGLTICQDFELEPID